MTARASISHTSRMAPASDTPRVRGFAAPRAVLWETIGKWGLTIRMARSSETRQGRLQYYLMGWPHVRGGRLRVDRLDDRPSDAAPSSKGQARRDAARRPRL